MFLSVYFNSVFVNCFRYNKVVVVVSITGRFSNNDGDGNESVKKVIVLLRKTTTLHVYHAFLYISLPSLQHCLHHYDVKMPNFTFYGGRKQATTIFSFSF